MDHEQKSDKTERARELGKQNKNKTKTKKKNREREREEMGIK